MVANDPAYYAYTAQRFGKGCQNIRVVSIGTGITTSQKEIENMRKDGDQTTII